MEDQEIIDQAVKQRDSGEELAWSINLDWAVMRDCGECAERVKRLHKAVQMTPLPTFTYKQLGKMLNDMEILGCTYRSFDKSVRVRYNGSLEIRGTLVDEKVD